MSKQKMDEVSYLQRMGADMLSTIPSSAAYSSAAPNTGNPKTLSESISRFIIESSEYPDRDKMRDLYEAWKTSINKGREIDAPILERLEKYRLKCGKFINKCDYLSGILFEYYKKKSGVNVPPAASSLPTNYIPPAASTPPVHSGQHIESNTSRESFDSHDSDSDVSVVGENRGGKKRKSMKKRKHKSMKQRKHKSMKQRKHKPRKTKNVYTPLSRRGK